MVKRVEVDFDDVCAGVVDPHTDDRMGHLGESLSHVSEYGGNISRGLVSWQHNRSVGVLQKIARLALRFLDAS